MVSSKAAVANALNVSSKIFKIQVDNSFLSSEEVTKLELKVAEVRDLLDDDQDKVRDIIIFN